jgi:hypothetical protein
MRASQCAAIFGASRVASAHAVSASMYCSWPANACAVSDQETPPSLMPRLRACASNSPARWYSRALIAAFAF